MTGPAGGGSPVLKRRAGLRLSVRGLILMVAVCAAGLSVYATRSHGALAPIC